jgi:hypothetical protein
MRAAAKSVEIGAGERIAAAQAQWHPMQLSGAPIVRPSA